MSSENLSLPSEVQSSVVHENIRYEDFLESHLREGFQDMTKGLRILCVSQLSLLFGWERSVGRR
jgi:hypothetical protein